MTATKPATRIVQRGRGHSYLLDGEKVPGVTKVIDAGVPKPQLIDWAATQSAKYAIDHWDELLELTPSARLEAIRGARWTTLREAGERGRDVHELVHRYTMGETVTPPEELAGHFDAGCRFVEEWQLEELAVEVAVFHRASLKGVFKEYALQLAAYRYADFYVLDGKVDEHGAAIEHPMPAIDATGVVWLRADGTYELVPLEADYAALEAFTAAQQLAAFAGSDRDDWIGSALRPPVLEPGEAAA